MMLFLLIAVAFGLEQIPLIDLSFDEYKAQFKKAYLTGDEHNTREKIAKETKEKISQITRYSKLPLYDQTSLNRTLEKLQSRVDIQSEKSTIELFKLVLEALLLKDKINSSTKDIDLVFRGEILEQKLNKKREVVGLNLLNHQKEASKVEIENNIVIEQLEDRLIDFKTRLPMVLGKPETLVPLISNGFQGTGLGAIAGFLLVVAFICLRKINGTTTKNVD